MNYSLKIFKHCKDLPREWEMVVGQYNILLSREYFCVLEDSCPENMHCFFVAFWGGGQLIGGALLQYLDFEKHRVLQQNKVSCSIRNFMTRKFSRDVLILGNNMLTGQNGFYFDTEKISPSKAADLLEEAIIEAQNQIKKSTIIIFKDYQASTLHNFSGNIFKFYFKFSVQPNMILNIRENWKTFSDYMANFSKKYRTRATSARKKNEGTEKRELNLGEIKIYQSQLNQLYHNVAENASFNTFFLRENHFESLKKHLKENFRLFGYFLDNELVGFYTMILNLEDIDTYFLGYNKELQKEKQLYLNMLLDMVEFGIKNQFENIIFGRTALEIKSTIGAEPLEIFGLIKHNNSLVNPWMNRIFPSIEPKTEWVQRRPFKESD